MFDRQKEKYAEWALTALFKISHMRGYDIELFVDGVSGDIRMDIYNRPRRYTHTMHLLYHDADSLRQAAGILKEDYAVNNIRYTQKDNIIHLIALCAMDMTQDNYHSVYLTFNSEKDVLRLRIDETGTEETIVDDVIDTKRDAVRLGRAWLFLQTLFIHNVRDDRMIEEGSFAHVIKT